MTRIKYGVQVLKAVERVVVPVETALTLILMVAISVCVLAGIVFRLLSITAPWTNELAQNLLVWLMFVGANLGIYYREHVAVTILPVLAGKLDRGGHRCSAR